MYHLVKLTSPQSQHGSSSLNALLWALCAAFWVPFFHHTGGQNLMRPPQFYNARSDMMFILSSGVNWTKSKSTFPIILHTSYFSSNNSNFDHVFSGIFYLNSSLNNFVLGVLLGHYPRHLTHTLWVDNTDYSTDPITTYHHLFPERWEVS